MSKDLFGNDITPQLSGYEAFVDKFKTKKTTDDCYTPSRVYDAVLRWVIEQVPEVAGMQVLRPFYPGGDFENFDYPDNCIVIDNPPFSIITKITRWYLNRHIRFFLFAPYLTVLGPLKYGATAIVPNAEIRYENGALVNTAFLTNIFDGVAAMSAPDLLDSLKNAQKTNSVSLPVYKYPSHVLTATMLGQLSTAGVPFVVKNNECQYISALASQRRAGKAIFGSGMLLSNKSAQTLERLKEEAKRLKEEANDQKKRERYATEWPLSQPERDIIAYLSQNDEVKE